MSRTNDRILAWTIFGLHVDTSRNEGDVIVLTIRTNALSPRPDTCKRNVNDKGGGTYMFRTEWGSRFAPSPLY